MILITKVFTFDCAHRLSDYQGKCSRIHGHTYRIEITLTGSLNEQGMVMDFGDLKKIYTEVIEDKFDHKILLKKGDSFNEKVGLVLSEINDSVCWLDYNPTAENMAEDIAHTLQDNLKGGVMVANIRLYETPTSYVDFSTNER